MDLKVLVRRFIAFLIDWSIMYGVAMALMFYGPGSDPGYFARPSIEMFTSAGWLLGCARLIIYCLFKDCLFGRRSLGKLICGLVVQSADGGAKASYGSLILRNLTYCIVPVEGILVLANNGRRAGDIIAKTEVVLRTK